MEAEGMKLSPYVESSLGKFRVRAWTRKMYTETSEKICLSLNNDLTRALSKNLPAVHQESSIYPGFVQQSIFSQLSIGLAVAVADLDTSIVMKYGNTIYTSKMLCLFDLQESQASTAVFVGLKILVRVQGWTKHWNVNSFWTIHDHRVCAVSELFRM